VEFLGSQIFSKGSSFESDCCLSVILEAPATVSPVAIKRKVSIAVRYLSGRAGLTENLNLE